MPKTTKNHVNSISYTTYYLFKQNMRAQLNKNAFQNVEHGNNTKQKFDLCFAPKHT